MKRFSTSRVILIACCITLLGASCSIWPKKSDSNESKSSTSSQEKTKDSTSSNTSTQTKNSQGETFATGKLLSDFPTDGPDIYTGADTSKTISTKNNDVFNVELFVRGESDVAKVREFYKNQAKAKGWTSVTKSDAAIENNETFFETFTKNNGKRNLTVRVTKITGKNNTGNITISIVITK